MVRIKRIKKTCDACPSQWEGQTTDGQWVYVRYRWGYLSVSIGRDLDEAVFGESLFEAQLGDGFDGDLTYDRLKNVTRKVVKFPAEEER